MQPVTTYYELLTRVEAAMGKDFARQLDDAVEEKSADDRNALEEAGYYDSDSLNGR